MNLTQTEIDCATSVKPYSSTPTELDCKHPSTGLDLVWLVVAALLVIAAGLLIRWRTKGDSHA